REKELEAIVDRLDMAFPPLGEEISEEEVEPEFICPCGSAKTFHQCCKGRKPKTGIVGQDVPSDSQAAPLFDLAQGLRAESRREDEETHLPQGPRTISRFGSPKWCEEGVDREAPDYGALEKAGQAFLHRQRALFNDVRHEGREVMRLLTQAAER